MEDALTLFLNLVVNNLAEILVVLIVAAAGNAVRYVGPLVKQLFVSGDLWLRSKLSSEQYQLATLIVQQGIRAAEQANLLGQIESEARKAFATNNIQAALTRYGIRLDANVVSGLIEAEVKTAFRDVFSVGEITYEFDDEVALGDDETPTDITLTRAGVSKLATPSAQRVSRS